LRQDGGSLKGGINVLFVIKVTAVLWLRGKY